MLETPDGRQVPGEFFPHMMKEYDEIRRFQVVQHEPGRIDVLLVVGPHWNDDDERRLERQIREVVGETVALQLNRVEDIPLTAAGKLRVVVNHWGSNKPPSPPSNPEGVLPSEPRVALR